MKMFMVLFCASYSEMTCHESYSTINYCKLLQGRVYKLQTEKLFSAVPWQKKTVRGLVEVAILQPVPVFRGLAV